MNILKMKVQHGKTGKVIESKTFHIVLMELIMFTSSDPNSNIVGQGSLVVKMLDDWSQVQTPVPLSCHCWVLEQAP